MTFCISTVVTVRRDRISVPFQESRHIESTLPALLVAN